MQSQSSLVQLVAESAEGFLQRIPPMPWIKGAFDQCKARPIGKMITVVSYYNNWNNLMGPVHGKLSRGISLTHQIRPVSQQ